MHAPTGVELALVEVRLAPGARHPQDRQRAEGVQVGDDEVGLEGPCRVVHRLIDRP